MTRFRLELSSIFIFALVAVVAAHAGRQTDTETTDSIPSRSFEFKYQVHVPANTDSARGRDAEYGNAFAAFTPTLQQPAYRDANLQRYLKNTRLVPPKRREKKSESVSS